MSKTLTLVVSVAALVLTSGCAHKSLSKSDLRRAKHPAFVARVEKGAGPDVTVFRDDGSYKEKLKQLDRKEADRRLNVKLVNGMTRFELCESLKAKTAALLDRDLGPWGEAVDPARVSSVLESLLVEDADEEKPDYEQLKTVGADSVVEFVIERYGMRSKNGKAGLFVEGYGRMFFLDGGEVWRRSFSVDQVDSPVDHVDPFRIAKEPTRVRKEMSTMLDAVAVQFAKDLSPEGFSAGDRPTPQMAERSEGTMASAPADEELPEPEAQ